MGAEVKYSAEIGDGSTRTDVTDKGADLVIDKADYAEIEPGCALLAKRPGTIKVRARYHHLFSNPILVKIGPAQDRFVRLEMEIDRQPLCVDETRPYRVLGLPGRRQSAPGLDRPRRPSASRLGKGRRVRQVTDPKEIPPPAIVEKRPPALVAKALGQFQVRAIYAQPDGQQIKSEVVVLDIRDGVPPDRLIAVRLRTPSTSASGSLHPGRDGAGRPSGRRPVEERGREDRRPRSAGPRQVRRPGLGSTRLLAAWGKLETAVAVNVAGDPFHRVVLREHPQLKPGNRFAVVINVEATGLAGVGLEYRAVTPGQPRPRNLEAGRRRRRRGNVRTDEPRSGPGIAGNRVQPHPGSPL